MRTSGKFEISRDADQSQPRDAELTNRRAAGGTGAAEFDLYADNYAAGMEHPLKRMLGATADAFIEPKVRWLLRQLRGPLKQPGVERDECRLLDIGCGTGLFLQTLYSAGFSGRARGCDISAGMLAEARWRKLPAALVGFDLLNGRIWPYDDATFDAATVCAVLHHVAPRSRGRLFREAARVLKPGGHLFVFEHNPFNPVTRLIVAQTPIDRNASLLYPGEVRKRLRRSHLDCLSTTYTMFAPPRIPWTERCEWLLGWLPLGGQYVVTARKPDSRPPRKPR